LDTDFYLGKALEHSLSFTNDPESAWFHLRVDANHDLRHVVAGYEANKFGEVCLLWFRFGQIRHWGIFTLGLLGVLSLIFTHRGPVLSALREAYNRGRGARNLDLVPWEDELDRPLAMHRTALGLAPPIHYPKSVAPEAYL
jgi:ubiquinone biosynthesis protein COQ4